MSLEPRSTALALLERASHLAQLAEHLQQAATGHGRMVFVGGEAGVGKTSLVDEFCRGAGGAAQVLWKSCDALSTPGPLGSLRDMAPALGLRIDEESAGRDGRDRLFRATLAALAARPDPTIVVGEDAHWADGATLEFLRFLARRIDDLRVLVVVTYRDDELGATHPLRRLLGDLATTAAVHRLRALPLSAGAVHTLAQRSGRDPNALHRLTGGNPFFLTEVLATEGETVPASVEDAILARASRLSPEARAFLDVASTIASTIYPDLMLTVAGPVLDQADECVARGLLRESDGGLVFRHELTRKAILGAITPPRRRLLHARVLAALRNAPPAERDLALLAHHAEEAGDREATLEFAIAAAEQAAALHAHREAAAQYARALRVAGHVPAAERARLLEERSAACYLSDQGEEAIAARRESLAIWRELGDRCKVGQNLRWLSRLCWVEGHGAEAEAAATAALEALDSLPPGPELAMAYSNLAQLRMTADDLDGTLLWGDRAIALAEQLGETETLIHALANVGTARAQTEDARGEDELTRSLNLSLDHGFLEHAVRALTNLAWAALWSMRLDEATRRLTSAIAYATEHDLDSYLHYLLATRATVAYRQGDWDAAETEVRWLLKQPTLSTNPRIMALTTLGHVAAQRDQPEAAALLDEALALAERTGQLIRREPVRAARAEATLLRGDRDQARLEAEAVRELVFARGNRWQRGEVAWLLWQAGVRDIPTDDLAVPYVHLIAGDFVAAAAAWQELGCPYADASALAQSDDPVLVRRALTIFESLAAKPAMSHAVQRLRELGVREVPPLRRGPRASTRASPVGLTRRETEVLGLLASGLRNTEIAERLYLTPKTVGHHVSAIYAKLGVATRTEAARIAFQLGITPS
ncbi:MAG: transcriptional regulator, LuxR family [Thermomicrobiales bacterium]|nr:transcriptional regulator, LuxR family [Thermomicrobiales bacterium]